MSGSGINQIWRHSVLDIEKYPVRFICTRPCGAGHLIHKQYKFFKFKPGIVENTYEANSFVFQGY